MATLNCIGERKIIEIIRSRLDLMPKMPIPFGDDVSAYDIGDGRLAVLKTDMLVRSTDVPAGMTLWQAARKAVVMNVSDFAAKGVKPLAVLVSLGLPRRMTEKDVEDIGNGLNAGAREYDAYVVGGDTGEALDLVISLSVFGVARRGEVMLRSGAKPGDIVAVTGVFGKTAAGLRILLDRAEAPRRSREVLVGSVLMPYARLKEGLALNRVKAVEASIDSSDGLAWSLHEIARASNVGLSISDVPTCDEVKKFSEANGFDKLELTLYGGEEYELVLAIRPQCWGKAVEAVEGTGGKLLPIGRVTAEKGVFLEVDGEKCVVEARGWEHFRSGKL